MKIGKILAIVGISMVATGMLMKIFTKRKQHYLVTDEKGRAYITNFIDYEEDCIIFYEPENDAEHRICGEFDIEKI